MQNKIIPSVVILPPMDGRQFLCNTREITKAIKEHYQRLDRV